MMNFTYLVMFVSLYVCSQIMNPAHLLIKLHFVKNAFNFLCLVLNKKTDKYPFRLSWFAVNNVKLFKRHFLLNKCLPLRQKEHKTIIKIFPIKQQ